MFRGFRTRLALTVIALVAATAAVVGVVSYALVERSLRTQIVDDAIDQTRFGLEVLATEEVLPSDADAETTADSGLAPRLLQRGADGVYVEFPAGGEPFATSLSLLSLGELIDQELRDLVTQDRLGYQFTDVADEPMLIVGARRPPGGPDMYLLFSAAAIEQSLTDLRRILVAVGLAVVAVAALVAGVVARGVLRPVRTASDAATRIATGDLSARVPVESEDEFGTWARAFNEMAASLEGKVADLEDAHAREQRFVADVSHELRTPLTALVNEAELLHAHLDEMPGPASRLGELLTADVARLRTLVEDLLEISRLEGPPADAELADVAVCPFLEAVVAARHPEAEVTCDAAGVIRTDRLGLERVIANLLDNARIHAPGAAVRVDASLTEEALTVVVADEGAGVPPEALPHLFERFSKVDPSRQGGTGLGLAIARSHAERLGGELTAAAHRPTGLAFRLTLPVTVLLHGSDPSDTSGTDTEGDDATSRQGVEP